MKHSLVTTSLAFAIGLVTLPAAHAANDGTINFTGNIITQTCQVEGSGPGQNLVNKTVDLGGIQQAQLATAGSTAGDKGFTITVGGTGDTACADGQTAYVRFDPASPALDHTTGRLNVDAGLDSATNLQVEILNRDGSPINLYSDDSMGVVIADNTAVIPMVARYYSLGAVGAGEAKTRVGFQVVYD